MTVKDIAQMLQSFGTELAETELPDDGKETERLLEAHAAKYRKLKVRREGSSVFLPGSLNTDMINVEIDFIYFFKKGCYQVGVKGGSSSSLEPGDLREGGGRSVGREDGLGDGAEVCFQNDG